MKTESLAVERNQKSAFGELLVGQLHPQFQGSFEYTVDNTDINTNTVVNDGTVTQSQGMAVLGTSTTTASTALFQSKRHAKYRPGLGGSNRFTALFSSPVAGTEQYIGLADETGSSATFKNGYIVGYDGTTFGYHRFQNDVKFTTALEDWDDPLDGTGASKITIDQTKLNIFFIPYQYLGAGAIRIYMGSPVTGLPVLVHTEQYENENIVPSVFNPNFKHVMWVNNGIGTSNLILKSSSYAYFIEGKTSYIELHQPQNSTGLIELGTITSEVAIFTIRNKTTYAGKTNFIDIILHNYGAAIEASSANNLATVHLTRNASLGGTPSYSNINTSNSVVEIDTSGTTVTGGIGFLHPPLAGKNDKASENLLDYKFILAPGETLTVSADSANSATIRSYLLWRELF